MLKPQLMRLGALTLVATTSAVFRGPLHAQGTQAAQEQVQLAFGYECDDRFLVRNDGSQNVTIEYNVAGIAERSQLQLKGKQSVEISSPSPSPLELRVGGKLVSTAHKGNTVCAPTQPSVVVRPLDQRDATPSAQPASPPQAVYEPPPVYQPQTVYQPQAVYPPQVVVVDPPYPVYAAPAPYYYYPYPYYSVSLGFPFFGRFGGYGYGRGVIVGRRR